MHSNGFGKVMRVAVDGAIRVKTKIDNSDIPKGLNEAKKKIQDIEKDIQKHQKAVNTATKGRAAISSQMSKYEEEIKIAEEIGEQAKANTQIEQQRLGIEQATAREIDRINAKYADTLAKAEQYDNEIASANNRIKELRALQSDTQAAVEGMQDAQKKATNETADTTRQSRRFRDTLKSAASKVKEMAQLLGGKVLSGAKKVASAIGNMAGRFKQLVTHNKSLNTGLGASAKNFAKMVLSMFSVQSVFSMLSKAANAYLSDNQQLQDQIQDMWSTLGAFMGPAIETIVAWLAKGVAYLNAFVKALTGIDVVAKRNAQAIEKQAKAQESLTSAAFDEQNKLSDTSTDTSAENSSSGFKIEEIQTPAWMERGADTLKKIGSLLKAGEWKKAAKTLTSSLNGIVKGVDWEKLGEKLGYYIDGALTFLATSILTFDWYNLGSSLATGINSLVDSVDWSNLGVVLGARAIVLIEGLGGLFATLDWAGLGQALADAFNGLWTAIDWEQAGKTLSDGVLGLLAVIRTTIANVDWSQVGSDIATYLASIDWIGILSELAGSISDILNGVLDLLLGFVGTIDWGKLGKDLWNGLIEVVTSIDWNGIISKAFRLLGTAVGGATILIAEFCIELWGSLKRGFEDIKSTYFEPYMNEFGRLTIEGFFKGIGDMICDIGTWIYNHIWVPFRDGFKDAFGIHSPSTKMQEFGRCLIDGLVLGIGDVWESVKSKFTDFANKITEFKTSVKSKAEDVGSAVSNGLKDGMSNLAEFVKSPINAMLTNIEKAFNSIVDKLNTFRIDIPGWMTDLTGMDSFGFDLKRISIPRLALGGIVNNPGRGIPAIVGEAGAEAVLPLERNTEWMDMLAERLNGGERNIVVQVILSGKKIHEEIIKLSNKRDFATNGVK